MNQLHKIISVSLLLLFSTLRAHHGKDFLVTASCVTPHKGLVCAHLSSNFYQASEHQPGYSAFSPGIIYGITDDWTTEFHSHIIHMAGITNLESFAIETRYRFLSERTENHHHEQTEYPFSLGALFEYEKQIHGTDDEYEGRLIASKAFGPVELVGNLVAANVSYENHARSQVHSDFELRYAFGIRSLLTQGFGATLELANSNSHLQGTQLTAGLNVDITKHIDLNIGTSFGLRHNGAELSEIHSMIMYTF